MLIAMIEESTGWGANCYSGQMWVPPCKVNEIIAFKITKSVSMCFVFLSMWNWISSSNSSHNRIAERQRRKDKYIMISRTIHLWTYSPKGLESNRPLDKIFPFLLGIYANFQSVSTINILDQMLSSLFLVPKIWGTAFNLSQRCVVSWLVVT